MLKSTIIVIIVAASAMAQQTLYRVRTLGVLPGRDSSVAGGINDAGQVAGQSFNELTSRGKEAFLSDPHYGMIGLGGLVPNGVGSSGRAISEIGCVAGIAPNAQGQYEGMFWSPESGMVGVGDLPGGAYSSECHGINDLGQVVGFSQTSDAGTQAFVWDIQNGMRGMGYMPGATTPWSIAFDINNAGQVVGYAAGPGGLQGFIWAEQAGYQSIPVGPDWIIAPRAFAINERGQVLISVYNGGGRSYPALWDPIDGVILITMPAEANSISLNGLNDEGIVVGSVRLCQFCYAEPFIWDRDRGFRPLLSLIDAGTPYPDNWIEIAADINNHGQISGTLFDRYEAVILEPFVLGDMNCDGSLNSFDIEPFLLTMQWLAGDDAARAEYQEHYPNCHGDWAADANQDGSVNQFDIQPFIDLLAP